MLNARSENDDERSNARKRSAPFVTKNACVACRKKRTRCDGNTPCGKCVAAEEPKCHYDVSTRVSKEAMREEIEILKSYKDASQRILGALAEDDGKGEVTVGLVAGNVIGALRSGDGVEEISQYLENEEMAGIRTIKEQQSKIRDVGEGSSVMAFSSHRASAQGTPMAFRHDSSGQYGSTSGTSTTPATLTSIISPEAQTLDHTTSSSVVKDLLSSQQPYNTIHWTSVTGDVTLMETLMAFYFCWEYPIFASLSKSQFLPDYFSGRRRYCSSLLVNAMLALGHRFLAASTSRSEDGDRETDPLAHRESGLDMGKRFQAEAERLLEEEKGNSLCTVQALGMLSLREASCGRNAQSWQYSCRSIKMAIEMGLQHAVPEGISKEEADVRSSTFYGAFALDQFWSLNVGDWPHISTDSIKLEKPHVVESEELENWGAYNNVMSPFTEQQQQANVRSVCYAFAELTHIINHSQQLLSELRDEALSRTMLAVYRQYLEWYADLPAVLRLGRNSTPSVLFAHIYYHYSLIILFRPFLRLRFANSLVVPRDICSEAASAISILVSSYRQLHSLRRTPSLLPYTVFVASVIHLICVGDEKVDESNQFEEAFDQDFLTGLQEALNVETAMYTDNGTNSPAPQRNLVVSPQVVRDIRDLNEMAACHAFAPRARGILVRMAMNWGISPPVDLVLSPAKVVDESSPSANIQISSEENKINWARVMEREGVFETQHGDRQGEGLPRGDSYNFFCPDSGQEMPLQSEEEVWDLEEEEMDGDGEKSRLFSPFLSMRARMMGMGRGLAKKRKTTA